MLVESYIVNTNSSSFLHNSLLHTTTIWWLITLFCKHEFVQLLYKYNSLENWLKVVMTLYAQKERISKPELLVVESYVYWSLSYYNNNMFLSAASEYVSTNTTGIL